MGWKAWYTVALIIVTLYFLCATAYNVAAVFVVASVMLYLVPIVELKSVFYGLTNDGSLAVAMLFILISPISQLPLVQDLVRWSLSGGTEENNFWPMFKVMAITFALSAFIEVVPITQLMTQIICQLAVEMDIAPSQYLLPMQIAVRLANWCLISASNNLVISGLMIQYKLGEMPFFEPAKVNIVMAFILLPYVVFLPKYLLPNRKGGLQAALQEKGGFMLELDIKKGSPLIGNLTKDVKKCSDSKIDLGRTTQIQLLSLRRAGVTMFPLTGAEVMREGDVLKLSGNVPSLNASLETLGVEYHMEGRNAAANPEDNTARRGSFGIPGKPAEENTEPIEMTGVSGPNSVNPLAHLSPGPRESANLPQLSAASAPAPPAQAKQVMFEVAMSASAPNIGKTIIEGGFERRYKCTVLAIRSFKGEVMTGQEMIDHPVAVADSILIMAPAEFKQDWNNSGRFITIVSLDKSVKEVAAKTVKFFHFPAWVPFGEFVGKDTETKVLRIPDWYNYLSILVFIGVIIATAMNVKLIAACICGVCALNLLGIMDTKESLQVIDYKVYVMIAFSFSIGIAVEESGLAAVIGYQIAEAKISGFKFLLLVSGLTTLLANAVTNKAAAQVMFPIIYRTMVNQGVDPLPAIMCLASTSVLPLFTSFGHATAVIVTGPGGYTTRDFFVFGFLLNMLVFIISPISVAIVYGFW